MGFGNTPLGQDLIPLGTASVPGTVDPVPIQGSANKTTDGNNNTTTPVNMNLKQVGDVLFALGQALKVGSIPVVLPSDQVVPVSATSLPLPTGAATQTTLASVLAQLQAGIAVNTISNYATENGNLASVKADLDTLSAIVSGGKGAVKAGAGDFADLATLAGIVSSNKASVKAAANDIADLATLAGIVSGAKATIKAAINDIADLATLLARHNDTFGTNTAISAATTFSAIPLVSALAANSYATLPNASYMATFSAQINVASAFVGTIGFYGLLPDGATLQQINAHQRGTATTTNATAINTGSALEQTWEGSIAAFKAIYVVCTAFTSGAASVQLGLTAADYAHAIINTVAQNLTQVGGVAPQLDGGLLNRLGVSLYGKNAAAGDTPFLLNADGSAQYDLRKVAGATLSQSNPVITELNIPNWIRSGNGFSYTNGLSGTSYPVTATNNNLLVCALSIFNPSNSGKNILIYSIKVACTGSGPSGKIFATTTDPSGTTGYTGVAVAANAKLGGAATVASLSASASAIAASPATSGTPMESYAIASGSAIEVLTNGSVILLPSGSANGISIMAFVPTAGQTFVCTAKGVEY